MFFVFIILGWVTPYTADLIPGLEANLLAYGLGGDLLLLASLFVRSLFTTLRCVTGGGTENSALRVVAETRSRILFLAAFLFVGLLLG